MQVAVIGINHKQADLTLREEVVKACQRRFFLENSYDEISSFVLLTTCNRCEIYFTGVDLTEAHQKILSIWREEITYDFEQKCYTFFGFDCLLHLARVTSGLDSAFIFETEIQGQVRTSYENAKNIRVIDSPLHFLFQKSLKIAKECRFQCVSLLNSVPNLEEVVLSSAKNFFEGRDVPCALFIGTSEINSKIANLFCRHGLKMTFCNRTEQSARSLIDEIGGEILPWVELHNRWVDFDFVISAIKSPTCILKKDDRPKLQVGQKKLLIDLGVPRNIDPEIVCSNLKLLNIDTLNELLEKKRLDLQIATVQADNFIYVSCEKTLALYYAKIRFQKVVV